MEAIGQSDEDGRPSLGEAVPWIEAALQAALGTEGRTRPDLAREVLDQAPREKSKLDLDAWLDAVALELQRNCAVLVPDKMVEAIAKRMLADRRGSLGAHAGIEERGIENLVLRP